MTTTKQQRPKNNIYNRQRHENPGQVPVERLYQRAALPVPAIEGECFYILKNYGWNYIYNSSGEYDTDGCNGIVLNPVDRRIEYKTQGDVYAVESGSIVERLKPDEEYKSVVGYGDVPDGRAWTPYIVLAADSGRRWVYRHVEPWGEVGRRVTAGQFIGKARIALGQADRPQVLLECYERGIRQDPAIVLRSFGFRQIQNII